MWQTAVDLRLMQLNEHKVVVDHGILHINKIPPGYQLIKVHLVIDVKHFGSHKARMVANEHLTQVPLNSVYV